MENIIENNTLIALFMGAKYENETGSRLKINELWLPVHGVVRWDTIEVGRGQTIHYHDSWDWLMPVVEKIESLGFDTSIDKCVDIGGHSFHIHDTGVYPNTFTTKIEAVYNAVVEFIKWYNNGTLSYNNQNK